MGRTPRRGERQERHDRRDPGNTGPTGTDSLDAQILEAVRPIRSPSWQVVDGSLRKRHGGQVASRDAPATGEGNPLKTEAQGRYRHETRPERLRAEQGVKRLRKPEDAAQPGWHARCWSLLASVSVVGQETPWEGHPRTVLRTVWAGLWPTRPGLRLRTPRSGCRARWWQHRCAPDGRPLRLLADGREMDTGFQ